MTEHQRKGAQIAGKILPARTLLFREVVGTAEANGVAYEMTTSVGDRSPIVESKQTGKWFVLSWQDIVNMAVEAGIDKP